MKSKLISSVKAFHWHQWLVVAMFLLAAGFTVFKAVQMTREVIYWQAHRDEPIREWMNVGYVSHSYRVPPDILYDALDLPQTPDRRPLRAIAKAKHVSMSRVRTLLQNAIVHARPPNPPPSSIRSEGLTDQLLSALSLYGLPVLFVVIVLASIALPLPVSLMLVAAGSFVQQGELRLWQVCLVACAAAVSGDQIGYFLARWGGRRLVKRITRKIGGEAKIQKAEAFAERLGGAGIFFSRWMVTSLGPWINVTSGMANYPWRRFIIWDVLGQLLWVALYVMLGFFFSDRVQAIAEILARLTWVILGFLVSAVLAWIILLYLRPQEPVTA